MLCKKVSVQEWANVDLLVSYSLKTIFENCYLDILAN